MLYYRGDRFVKGKKFTINESVYKFVKKTKENELIFESIEDNSTLKINESEFCGKETLIEKINQENKEINELIGKILRSKSLARKNEDMLNKYGITVDYGTGQGVILTGPNGKTLYSSTKEVHGPSRAGFNGTHEIPDDLYASRIEYCEKREEELQEELEKLKSLDRDDIIRKYSDLSTAEALKKHDESINKCINNISYYKTETLDCREKQKVQLDRIKRDKRAGHKAAMSYHDKNMGKEYSNKHVDYLTYLTKNNSYKPYERVSKDVLAGSSRQYNANNPDYHSEYTGKNGAPASAQRSERLKKYDSLKRDIESKKRDADRNKVGGNGWYAAKSDEELEAQIQAMRDELEANIEGLRNDNNRRKENSSAEFAALKAKEKELDDYLKSLGIRESVRTRMIRNAILKESAGNTQEPSVEDTVAYFGDIINTLYEKILDAAKEAQYSNLNVLSKSFDKMLDILDNYEFINDNIIVDDKKESI